MKKNAWIHNLFFYGNRAILLYLIIGLVIFVTIDFRKTVNAAKLTVLNRLLPSFTHIMNLAEGRELPDKKALRGCRQYYEKVVLYMPQLAEAHGLLGFCYFHAGDREKARMAYEKAALLNPHFFWSHYNLGLIAFKEERWAEAAASFQKALTTQPDLNIRILQTSQIYKQIKLGSGRGDYNIPEHLKNGYEITRMLLILSYARLKNDSLSNNADAFEALGDKINLRPF